MKGKQIFLWIAAGLLLAWSFKAQEPQNPDILSLTKTAAAEQYLQAAKADRLMEWQGRIYIVATANDRLRLDGDGVAYRVETSRFDLQAPLQRRPQGDGLNGIFHSYAETESELLTLQQAYPQLARLEVIGSSLEGRNISALKVSANAGSDEAKAEVLFTGCHHAREWLSLEVPLLMARYLLENYGSNSGVKSLVDHCAVWFVPLVNPDGLEYSINVYRLWRKNRRLNPDGSFGVDINRNYSYKWGLDDNGSSSVMIYEDYRGTGPFSEPEIRALRDFSARRHIQAAISYHTYGGQILFPWNYTSTPAAGFSLMNAIAAEMASRIQAVNGSHYIYGQGSTAEYVTNGDFTDWAYATYGIPAYTIELPPVDWYHGGFFAAEKDIAAVFAENVPAMSFLIQYAIDHYVAPQVSDNSEREPRRHPAPPPGPVRR